MLLMSAPDPNPMMAPVSRSESDQRRASPAPSSSEAAASPPHIAAAYALIGRPPAGISSLASSCRAAGGILPTLKLVAGGRLDKMPCPVSRSVSLWRPDVRILA